MSRTTEATLASGAEINASGSLVALSFQLRLQSGYLQNVRSDDHFPRHSRRHRHPPGIKAGRLRRPTHNGGGNSGPSQDAQQSFHSCT
jgi:hypothetical protein